MTDLVTPGKNIDMGTYLGTKDSSLLGCDAVTMGKYFLVDCLTLKMSATIRPVTLHHIPEDLNL